MAGCAVRIWGRIEHIGPSEFAIIVTVLPMEAGTPTVRLSSATSREIAQVERDRLMAVLQSEALSCGTPVVEMERDGSLRVAVF